MKRVGTAPIRPAWPAAPAPEGGALGSLPAALLSPSPPLGPVEVHTLPSPPTPTAADFAALRRASAARASASPSASSTAGAASPSAPPAASPAASPSSSDPVERMLESVAALLALHDEARTNRIGGVQA